MSDRRVRRVLATGRVGNLPLEILRVIWQDVHRAGRRARRALRRYFMKIQVINALLLGIGGYPDDWALPGLSSLTISPYQSSYTTLQ